MCIIWFSIISGFSVAGILGVWFASEPADVTKIFIQGSSEVDWLTFDCKVSFLDSKHKFSWIKNGKFISDDNEFRSIQSLVDDDRYFLTTATNFIRLSVYLIAPATAQFDSGSYQCAVTWSNDTVVYDGISKTAYARIWVLDSIPSRDTPICEVMDSRGHKLPKTSTTPVRQGNLFTLICLSQPATSYTRLRWYNNYSPSDEVQLSSADNTNGFKYSTFNWISYNNRGLTLSFTCVLDFYGWLPAKSCSISFDVQYAPIVTIDPTDVMVTEENDEMMLYCNQDANPQVTEPVWYYDDDVVNNGGRFKLEGMNLSILTFDSRDNGEHLITCVFANEVGTGNACATVTVQISLPISAASTKSSLATISITSSSYSKSNTHPKDKQNIAAIAGGTSGTVLLIIISIFVTVLCFKARRKSTSPPALQDLHVVGNGSEYELDINDVQATDFSQACATENSSLEDGALPTRVIARMELNHHGNPEHQTGNYEDDDKVLNTKPKKVKKILKATSGTDLKLKADIPIDVVSPPAPGKNFSENTQPSEAENGHHWNMLLKSDEKQKLKKKPTSANQSAYENVQQPEGKHTDRFYDEIHNSEKEGYTNLVVNDAGGEEANLYEKTAKMKNVEGLTYADLDLSNMMSTQRMNKAATLDGSTLYSDLQM